MVGETQILHSVLSWSLHSNLVHNLYVWGSLLWNTFVPECVYNTGEYIAAWAQYFLCAEWHNYFAGDSGRIFHVIHRYSSIFWKSRRISVRKLWISFQTLGSLAHLPSQTQIDVNYVFVAVPEVLIEIPNTYRGRLIFVVPSIMLYSSEIILTRCNNCVFIFRNGFTLHVSGDNLTHHQEYICYIRPQVSRLT